MAERNDGKGEQILNPINQENLGAAGAGKVAANIGGDPGSQHNDWGHSQSGEGGNVQSAASSAGSPAQPSNATSSDASVQQAGAGGNIGGVPGSQHNDWGHSAVGTGGNRQAQDGANAQSASTPRQGVMPGAEMGHLQRDGGKDRDGGQKT